MCTQVTQKIKLSSDTTVIHPSLSMPRNEIDPSLITNEPRKRKMAAYVTNEDNMSADKDETVKRLKRTVGPCESFFKILAIF